MMQTIIPNKYIKIGLLDNKVVEIDWGDFNFQCIPNKNGIYTGKVVTKFIKSKLKEAIKFLK
jgi:hypothetical protein